MSSDQHHEDQVLEYWGVPIVLRLACIAMAAAFPIFSIWGLVTKIVDDEVDVPVLVLVPMLCLVGFFSFRTSQSSVTLTSSELIVRNVVGRARIQREWVVDVGVGYHGLTIAWLNPAELHGRSVNASAVQKPNYAAWAGKRTRGDDVVDRIREWAGLDVTSDSVC